MRIYFILLFIRYICLKPCFNFTSVEETEVELISHQMIKEIFSETQLITRVLFSVLIRNLATFPN